MKALLIAVDFRTGERPECIPTIKRGNVRQVDGTKLPTLEDWQFLESGCEIRIILDEDTSSQYRGKDGVKLLNNDREIDREVERLQGACIHYSIARENLMLESIKQKGIRIDDLGNDLSDAELAEELHKRGALGIRKKERVPVTAEKMAEHFRSKGKERKWKLP